MQPKGGSEFEITISGWLVSPPTNLVDFFWKSHDIPQSPYGSGHTTADVQKPYHSPLFGRHMDQKVSGKIVEMGSRYLCMIWKTLVVDEGGCILCPDYKTWVRTGNGGVQNLDPKDPEGEKASDEILEQRLSDEQGMDYDQWHSPRLRFSSTPAQTQPAEPDPASPSPPLQDPPTPEIAASSSHMIQPTDDHKFVVDGPVTWVG